MRTRAPLTNNIGSSMSCGSGEVSSKQHHVLVVIFPQKGIRTESVPKQASVWSMSMGSTVI